MSQPENTTDIVEEAIRILRRNLPGGNLSDHDTVSELWGLLDNANTEAILARENIQRLFAHMHAANDQRRRS